MAPIIDVKTIGWESQKFCKQAIEDGFKHPFSFSEKE